MPELNSIVSKAFSLSCDHLQATTSKVKSLAPSSLNTCLLQDIAKNGSLKCILIPYHWPALI